MFFFFSFLSQDVTCLPIIFHNFLTNLSLHKAEKLHLHDHHRNHMHKGSWNLEHCEPKVWGHKLKCHIGEAPKLQAPKESWSIGTRGSRWHAKKTIPSMHGGPIWGHSTMCKLPNLLLVPQANWKRWLETRFCTNSGSWRLTMFEVSAPLVHVVSMVIM